MNTTLSLSPVFCGLFGHMPALNGRRRRIPAPVFPQSKPPLQPAIVKPQSPQLAALVLKMVVEYFRDRDPSPDPEVEAISFLRAHAGCTIVVPTMPMIERLALEHSIMLSVQRDPSARTASRIAMLHNIPRRQVSNVSKRARPAQHCRHPRMDRFKVWVKV